MMTLFLLSAALGFPFGGAMYLIFRKIGFGPGLSLTLFAAVLFTLLLFVFLVIHQKTMDKRYARIEEEIPYPVFYRSNGNFDLGGGKVKNGNIYFCDAGIVCVSMEEKPHTLDEVPVEDIHKISFDAIHLHIHTKSGRLFKITLPDAARIVELLKEKDWVG